MTLTFGEALVLTLLALVVLWYVVFVLSELCPLWYDEPKVSQVITIPARQVHTRLFESRCERDRQVDTETPPSVKFISEHTRLDHSYYGRS